MTRRLPALAITAALLLLAACGDDEPATSGRGGARTIEVDMVDIAFEPTKLDVAEGETVRLVFTNRGKVTHDAFIGGRTAQAEHEADMREGGGHDHGDDDSNAVTVEPGDTAELTYTFDEPGTVEIGCHQPGHYAAGMKITVEVA